MSTCALCEERIAAYEIVQGTLAFCCQGCSAVYRILESQNRLAEKKTHPIVTEAVRFGLISNPLLADRLLKEGVLHQEVHQKWVFEIEEMWCPACAQLIGLVLDQQKGIIAHLIDYATDIASIDFNPQSISREAIDSIIARLGYKVRELEENQGRKGHKHLILQFAVAGFCALNVMMFAYPLYSTSFSYENEGMRPLLAWISLGLTVPVLAFAAAPLYRRIWNQAKHGIMAMESLVGLGIASAMGVSLYEMYKNSYHIYFDTVTVLVTFLLLGKLIESKAKFSAKEALIRIRRALPRKGRKRLEDGTYRFVPLKEVEVGHWMAVHTGERIALDGIVMEGEGSVDESIMTGECQPRYKKVGDRLMAGSILQSGELVFQVLVKKEASTLNHILALIEREAGNKSRYTRSSDKIAAWFTPLVLAVAFFTFMGTYFFISPIEAISRAMAVVLIACPCAIGIAAPLIEAKLIQRFTENGALIQNRAVLEKLPQITHFVFDKTGTITDGDFQLIAGIESIPKEALAQIKALAMHSQHPISRALDRLLSCAPASFQKIHEIPGKGMRGGYCYLGSKRWMEEIGFLCPPEATVYFANEEKRVWGIQLGDVIKQEASSLLIQLHPLKKILLSGDQKKEVAVVANALGFDTWMAEKTPEEKQRYLIDLKNQGAFIAMMGDGINDAPALAKADVGISVVSAADISIHISDILLTTSSLMVVPKLMRLAKKGRRLIHQNLFWAFFYNIVGVGLAMAGMLTPLFASFAMIASSLMVLVNAKRVTLIE